MNDVTKCLKEIEKIRGVAAGSEVAYVARSRIARLVLSVTCLVCSQLGMPEPDRPGHIVLPKCASDHDRLLATICNRLTATAKTITQPSEPLDDRWRSGWSLLSSELDALEHQLRSMQEASLVKS